MRVSHVYSQTVADGTATSVVRPSDWNSAHNLAFTLGGNTTNASTVSGTGVTFAGAGPVSVGGSNGSLVISGQTVRQYRPFELGNNTTYSAVGQSSISFQHFIPDEMVHFSTIELWARGTFSSSTNSQSVAHTLNYGIYSQDTGANSTRMTLVGSSQMLFSSSYNSNTAAGFTISQGASSFTTTAGGTTVLTNASGPNHLYLPFAGTLLPDQKYALALHVITAGATVAGSMQFMHMSMMNSRSMGRLALSGQQLANVSVIGDREMGTFSAQSAGLPGSYATSQLGVAVSRMVIFAQFETS